MTTMLTWLPDVLLAAGLKVSRTDGWETRGREGPFGPIKGVICHHTAGSPIGNMPSLNTLIHGRAGTQSAEALPGPLAQLGLGRDGTFYLLAAGRANHAGAGKWNDEVSGNTNFIGIEAEHTGRLDDPWPDVQLDAYKRGIAAILSHINADTAMCCGHKEWAPTRKIDPCMINMSGFRADVAAIVNGSGTVRPLIPPVDDQQRATIRRGNSGALVIKVQAKLGLEQDGDFGTLTEAAVRTFQRAKGLVPDGIVGPKCWLALDSS